MSNFADGMYLLVTNGACLLTEIYMLKNKLIITSIDKRENWNWFIYKKKKVQLMKWHLTTPHYYANKITNVKDFFCTYPYNVWHDTLEFRPHACLIKKKSTLCPEGLQRHS